MNECKMTPEQAEKGHSDKCVTYMYCDEHPNCECDCACNEFNRLTAENAALVEAIQGLISADTPEEKNRAQCAALDLINPLPEGGRDFHALEKR